MNIIFIHKGFTGQFKFLAPVLAKDPNNTVYFITSDENGQVPGVHKFVYKLPQKPQRTPSLVDSYEDALLHGQAVANMLINFKRQGVKPDIIYGHSGWGTTMFAKDIFPDVPLLCYFEWYENAEGAAEGFNGKLPDEKRRITIRCSNSHKLMELVACDAGLSPTHWQKSQYPIEFQDKIKVIHDGVSTENCKPYKNARFIIPETDIELTSNDEIITYATRGMEPFRGFPQFMEAAEKILKKRPNAQIIIGGINRTFYGDYLSQGSYKDIMLKKLKLDMNRIHFIGELKFMDYIKLLQVSSVHVYATVPFVLSWSLIEAMSTGCCIVASNTAPVVEVIQDNYNGLLYDFYNVDMMVEKIEYALDNKEKMKVIRDKARQTVVDKYDIVKLYPQHVEYINSLIKR